MGTADEESRICVEHGGSEPGALLCRTALTGIKSWFRIWVLGRARFQPCRSRPGKMRALAPEGTCLPGGRAFIKPAQVFSIGFWNQKLRGKPSPSARVMWNLSQFSANGCTPSAYFLDAAKIKLDGPLKKPQRSSAWPHARWLWLETMRSTFCASSSRVAASITAMASSGEAQQSTIDPTVIEPYFESLRLSPTTAQPMSVWLRWMRRRVKCRSAAG